ncbi:hypothetical protein JCM19241_1510 [Vibrio ishigakensis]|uniref:Uncharacterized protein n=1 Tax=Vibrio ishigakensis TaxID=1481914 RepID=A0A0B8QDW0_9VIBR|nr:hypothetical protein JCM19241_1510 [Vibrio ishigakensis]
MGFWVGIITGLTVAAIAMLVRLRVVMGKHQTQGTATQ